MGVAPSAEPSHKFVVPSAFPSGMGLSEYIVTDVLECIMAHLTPVMEIISRNYYAELCSEVSKFLLVYSPITCNKNASITL